MTRTVVWSHPLVHFPVPAVKGPLIYRLRDASGELLYVGCTVISLRSRLVQHGRMQPWWSDVAEVTYEMCLSDVHALYIEWQAINTENPRYNVQKHLHPAAVDPDGKRCFPGTYGNRRRRYPGGVQVNIWRVRQRKPSLCLPTGW